MKAMSDIRKMLERSVDGYAPDPEAGLAATLRLAARRDRHRRVGVAAVALALFLATAVALGFALTFRGRTSPASSPSPHPPSARPATPVVVPAAAPAAGGISLCAAAGPGADCAPNATFRLGDVVRLRGGRRQPSLPEGTRVEVWRRASGHAGWRRIDVVTADKDGQILWTWRSPESDPVHEGTYGFQLLVPSLGASPVLEVRLLRDE